MLTSPESINWAIAILTALFSTGGIAAIWKVRLDKRKAPLDREQALSVVAQHNVDAALAISKESNDIAREARADAKAARQEASEARAMMQETKNRYANLERSFDALWHWMTDIVQNWSVVRLREDPPPIPPEAQNHH